MPHAPHDLDLEMLWQAPVGLFVTDLEGQCLRVNRAWCALTGQPPEALLGEGWWLAWHPLDAERLLEAWLRAARRKTELIEEGRLQRPDGRVRWVELRAQPMRDEHGGVRGQIGTVLDIDQRKAAEQAAAERDQRLKAALTSAMDAILFLESVRQEGQIIDFRILEATGGVDGVFGGRNPTLSGQSLRQAFPALPDHVFARYARIVETGEPLDEERPAALVAHSGRWVRVRAVRLNDGLVVAGRDITTQKRHEEELRRGKEAAEAASQSKSELLANVSHETRTPLNGVLGLLELALNDEGPSTPAHRERLMLARRSAESLLYLLNDLLDLAKIEAGKMQLTLRPFDLRAELAQLLLIAEARARNKGLSFRAELPTALPERVVGDAERLRQILHNLLDNAFKFTDQGFVWMKVCTAPHDASTIELSIEVSDTGIGIPGHKQARVFVPFEQADSSSPRRHGGTGLGLAICAELARLMRGQLRLESEAGQGSAFTLTVLLERDSETERPPSFVPPSLALSSLPPLHVLLVEDHDINQLVATRLLEQGGHRVTLAQDGHEAMQRLSHGTFDAVLMDVQIPLVDGLAVTRWLRQLEHAHGRHTPVIAVTARASADDRIAALQAGVDDYLAKPFHAAELAHALQQLIATRDTTPPRPITALRRADVDATRRLLGNSLFQELVQLFLAHFRLARAELSASLDTQRFEPIAPVLHRLVGALGALGAKDIARRAQRLEQLILQGDQPEVAPGLRTFLAEVDVLCASLASPPDGPPPLSPRPCSLAAPVTRSPRTCSRSPSTSPPAPPPTSRRACWRTPWRSRAARSWAPTAPARARCCARCTPR